MKSKLPKWKQDLRRKIQRRIRDSHRTELDKMWVEYPKMEDMLKAMKSKRMFELNV